MTNPNFKRRTFLQASGAIALLRCGPGLDVEIEDELGQDQEELTATFTVDTARFPLGVMAGEVTADSVVLWTSFTGTTRPILRVYEVQAGGNVRVHSAQVRDAEMSDAGFIHVKVDGLKANHVYRYRFLVDPGAANKQYRCSHLGTFHSGLAAGSRATLTFAGIACTNPATGEREENDDGIGFKVLNDASKRDDLDFMLHLGDHVYADSANTRAEYRGVYERQWRRVGMRNLHKSTVMLEMWDDHEVHNNWSPGDTSEARYLAARGAALEHRPMKLADPSKWWRSFKFGDTAELWLLDVRSERKEGSVGNPLDGSNPEQYISKKQLDWLKRGLKASTAVFKFICTPQPITNWPGVPTKDAWEKYSLQRADLLRFINGDTADGLTKSERRGVFFLGGDVHMGSYGHVGAPGSKFDAIREIVVGPGGAASPNGGVGELRSKFMGAGKQFSLVTGRNNYTVIKVNPDATGRGGTLNVRFVGVNANGGRDVFFEKTVTI